MRLSSTPARRRKRFQYFRTKESYLRAASPIPRRIKIEMPSCSCFDRLLGLDKCGFDNSNRQHYLNCALDNYASTMRQAAATQTKGEFVLFKDLLDSALEWTLSVPVYRQSLVGILKARHDCALVYRLCTAFDQNKAYSGVNTNLSLQHYEDEDQINSVDPLTTIIIADIGSFTKIGKLN